MRTVLHAHNGAEAAVPADVSRPLLEVLDSTEFNIYSGCANYLRKIVLQRLRELGWTDRVSVFPKARITITAVNGDAGLCLQFGNMARFYADLLKLQAFYLNGRIRSGIFVVFTKKAAIAAGSNLTNFSRLTKELCYFGDIITLPILVIGLEGDDHGR